jgi:hypothetical protein
VALRCPADLRAQPDLTTRSPDSVSVSVVSVSVSDSVSVSVYLLFGLHAGPTDSTDILRALLIGDCSRHTSCAECLAAGPVAADAALVATGAGGGGGGASGGDTALGCSWCAGRRRQCVPDLRGMCRSEATHLRNASQCEQTEP